jgi:hypothetical protein
MKRYLLAALCVALFTTYAIAQTVTPIATPDTSFDLSEIKGSVITILGSVMSAVAIWIGITVRSWIGAKYNLDKTTLDEKLQAIFDVAAKRGIAFAETTLNEKIPSKVDINSVFVKTAADYLSSHWPDIVKKTGMTPQGVEDAIVSRLPSPTGKEADTLALVKAGAAATVDATKAVTAKP